MDFIIWKVKRHKSKQTKQNNQTNVLLTNLHCKKIPVNLIVAAVVFNKKVHNFDNECHEAHLETFCRIDNIFRAMALS